MLVAASDGNSSATRGKRLSDGASDGHVSARAHRDSNLRLSESGSIVNSIASHGDKMTFALKTFHDVGFVLRQNFSHNFVDLEFAGHCLGCCSTVSSEHHNTDAVFV